MSTSTPTCRPSARTAATTLAKQAAWLKQYTNYQITIEGNCDERGTREYNFALGERRANAVRQYLVAQGVPAARIKTISYGKERPEVVGSDEGSWARNRVGVTALAVRIFPKRTRRRSRDRRFRLWTAVPA